MTLHFSLNTPFLIYTVREAAAYAMILPSSTKMIRLIEFDGPQHYEIGSGYYNSEEKIARTQKHDNLKNQYAFDHNIPLVRIPYKERDNITLELLLGDKYLLHSPS